MEGIFEAITADHLPLLPKCARETLVTIGGIYKYPPSGTMNTAQDLRLFVHETQFYQLKWFSWRVEKAMFNWLFGIIFPRGKMQFYFKFVVS